MLSDVVAVGLTKQNLKRGFRSIYFESKDVLTGKRIDSYIPCLYWTREEGSRLNRYKEGSELVLQGHIESDEEYGLFILVESIHFTK